MGIRCFVRLILVTLATGSLWAGLSPDTGQYVFQRYLSKQYAASPQNWAIAQDGRGLMNFGNTDGLLEFDGVNWRLIVLPKNSAVRSLAADDRGNIYVGGIGVFGLLQDDGKGDKQFVSLLDKVGKEEHDFADVWRTLMSKHGIYFSSYKRIFLLRPDGTIATWRPGSKFGRAFLSNNELYVKNGDAGLSRLHGSKFDPVSGGAVLQKDDIAAAIPDGEGTLVASSGALFRLRQGSLSAFPTEADGFFAKNTIYSMFRLSVDVVAVGTKRGGLVLLDTAGKVLRMISKKDGLPSDYVTAMEKDSQGGVWLTGYDSGIARFNPGLSKFVEGNALRVDGLPSDAPRGNVLAVKRIAGNLFVGTTAGLFRMQVTGNAAPTFRQIEGIETSQYALLGHGDEVISAGGKGVWSVRGDKAQKILEADVIYDASLGLHDPDVIYAAGRGPVFKLRKERDGWKKVAEVPGSGPGFRSVLEDVDGKVWATTPAGVWRIDFTKEPAAAEKFAAPEGVRTNVYRLRNGVVFSTGKGLMRFSEKSRSLVPDPKYGNRSVSSVVEASNGDTWITGPGYHAVLRPASDGFKWYQAPLIESGIDEIYAMFPDLDGTIWASGSDYILHRWESGLSGNPDQDFKVISRRVEVIGSNVKGETSALALPLKEVPHQQNALRFYFASPFFQDPASVEYQVKLEGSDKDWSAWSHETRKDYTNLPENSYQFLVRARSPHGTEASESSLQFGVAPPWYRTWWAYLSYVVLLVLGVWGVIRWRVRQLEEDKRKLEAVVVERTAEVCEQRDQVSSLLLNILPAAVASELRHTGSVKPMSFEDVTVCFTDFVGFTLSSEKLPPVRLVDALNEYFTAFDEIIGRYGLEKLKTIGDSYMFVSGLPERKPSHAVDAVLAALEMVEVVDRIAARDGEVKWRIRIGLHSGPVIAGVVGVRKFAFDIWGNTVNFAARMESSGVPGRVNLSARTCRLLGNMVECEPRGLVRIKEGRELEMFLARGPVRDFKELYEHEFGASVNGGAASWAARAGASLPAHKQMQISAASAPTTPYQI